MAKQATKEEPTNPVALKATAGLPAELAARMEDDANKGVSKDQSDNLVPLIYILQTNSPQVNKRGPDYIEGAEPGDIWLRNANPPIVQGANGFRFQPCFFYKDWVEWKPRDSGGGFIGRHDKLPDDAERRADPENPNRVRNILPNGNEMVETRYHVGFVITDDDRVFPYIIPMTSTGHTTSRQWMFMMNSKSLPNGKTAPSWAFIYRLRTKEKSNAAGTWFGFEVVDDGWVQTPQDYERGLKLHEAMSSGAKQAEAPVIPETEEAKDKIPF